MTMFRHVIVLIAALLIVCPAHGQSTKPKTRSAFARALGTIKSGMTKAQVRAILGEPDQILDEADCAAEGYDSQTEKWDYGADKKFNFPTLGSVGFEGDRCDGAPWHYKNKSIKDGLVDEQQLRSLLQLMYEGENVQFQNESVNADPLYTIRIVNALLPLGKEKALAVVREYARVRPCMYATDNMTVYNAVRALFKLPENTKMPNLIDYAGVKKEIAGDPSYYVADPFIIYKDIPLFLVDMSGHVEQSPLLEKLAAICERSGEMRTKPLLPSNDLAGMAKQIELLPEWSAAVDRITKAGRRPDSVIRRQLAMLVRTAVVPNNSIAYISQIGTVMTYEQWEDMIARATGYEWDVNRQEFVGPKGEVVTEHAPAYKKFLWNVPGLEEWNGHVIAFRTGYSLCVKACWKPHDGKLPDATIRVLGGDEGASPLGEFHLPDAKVNEISHELSGATWDFPEGEPAKGTYYEWLGALHAARKMTIQVEIAGKTITSPLFDFSD